jgi:hypothetical protein
MTIAKPELMLFDHPVFQTAVEKGLWIDVHPINSIMQGPIEFLVNGGIDYLDLASTVLYIKAKIIKADGTAYTEPTEVGFVNNAMHSMFSDIFVTLGSEVIEGGDSMYPYKAIMSTLFSFSEQAMQMQLPSVGFIKDQSGKMDDKENSGFVKRKLWTTQGSKEFMGKLFVDMLQQPQYLLNAIDLRFKLVRAKNEFCICNYSNTEKPKVVIDDAILYVRKCKINPTILIQHEMSLQKEAMTLYPINRIDMQTYTIPAQSKAFRKDNLFYNKRPNHLIFGMVSNNAYNGKYELNPFNFHHFNLNYVTLIVDGESTPFQAFTPDFTNRNCLRDYNSLYMSAGNFGKDSALPISYNDFLKGYTLYIFNLAPDLTNNPTTPYASANIRLELKFEEELPITVTLILMASFHSVLQIDQVRNVFCDYKA